MSSSPPHPTPTLPIDASTSTPLQVVVVDDDELVGRVLKRALRQHQVTVYPSATQALRVLLEASAPDVVITDLLMPDLPGWELYSILQAQRPALAARLMFITGGVSAPSILRFLASCPQPCLEKPFELAVVRRQVAALAQGSR